jgi:hypothetical protein
MEPVALFYDIGDIKIEFRSLGFSEDERETLPGARYFS